MKSNSTPILPLLKLELGAGQISGSGYGLLFGFHCSWWLLISLGPTILMLAHRGSTDIFWEFRFLIAACVALWFQVAMAFWTHALVPPIWKALPYFRPFEFMFTRAIDRRVNFRAKTMALWVMLLSPLIVGIALSAWEHPFTFPMPEPGETRDAYRLGLYMSVFPGCHAAPGRVGDVASLMIIPHGTFIFALWQFWTCLFMFTFAQGCSTLISWIPPRAKWLLILLSVMPGLLVVALVAFWPTSFFEDYFLWFARQRVALCLLLAGFYIVTQTAAEHRFTHLEVE